MTKEDIENIKKWIATLTDPEEIAGATDALNTIIASKLGMGGGKPPSEAEVDPDLENPDPEPESTSEMDPDTEIEDPDKVLDRTPTDEETPEEEDHDGEDSSDEESDGESDGESTEDSEESESEAGDTEDEDASSSEDNSDSDTPADKSSTPASDTDEEGSEVPEEGYDDEEFSHSGDTSEAEETDETESSDTTTADDDMVDDTGSIPDDVLSDQESAIEKERKFSRQVSAASALSQVNKALKKLEEDPSAGSDEDKKALEQTRDALSKMIEDIKAGKDLSAEEFNSLISKAIDLANKINNSSISIDRDRAGRVSKIESEDSELDNEDLTDEDEANIAADPERKKLLAREAEKKRLEAEIEKSRTRGLTGGITKFTEDLKKALGDQIAEMIEIEEATWARENRHHVDDDIAVAGVRIDEIPEYKKPTVDVYFDQSGSWGYYEVEQGLAAIADILALEKKDLLTINIYYFSKILSQDQAAARAQGSQECWDLVIDNINTAPKTKNVIIMTDSDIACDYGYAGHHGCIRGAKTTVDGCVWFIWKHGYRVPEATVALKGRKGTFEYSL